MMDSIELFAGAGGLALGGHLAGFHHLLVLERDHDACDTLRLNRERQRETGVDWKILEADAREVDYHVYPAGLDMLSGGAPCQPFSLGGKHAGEADPRNMFPEVFRAVRELRPRAIFLENVRGLLRENFRPYFDYIVEQVALPHVAQRPDEGWQEHKARLAGYLEHGDRLHELGEAFADEHCYDVRFQLYNVADMGIPQERHRVFIVGFRRDLGIRWAFPTPTHSKDALLYAQYIDGSYWEEHGLPPQPVPERFARRVAELKRLPRPIFARWRTVRDALCDLPEPVDYEAHPAYDNHVGIPNARAYPGHTGSPWDWPAKAIKAGDHGNPGGENMLRRDDGSVRYFTVRELARLQTFPDNWYFANSWTESRRQLGNAVPVAMAELLARDVHAALASHDERRAHRAHQVPRVAEERHPLAFV
jgi:DNA (cytosine-5)-methyltransferase 1